ncbi:MAG TPA: hypothetical protein VIJ21_02140 [Solirubrobacterales bacterium]
MEAQKLKVLVERGVFAQPKMERLKMIQRRRSSSEPARIEYWRRWWECRLLLALARCSSPGERRGDLGRCGYF